MRIHSFVGMVLTLGFTTFAAQAQDDALRMSPFSSFDAYLTYADLQSDTGGAAAEVDDSDIGGGLRLRMAFGDLLFISAAFQSVKIDNPELSDGSRADNTTIRFREQRFDGGLRYAFGETDFLTVFGTVGEYRPRIQLNTINPGTGQRISESGLIFGGGVEVKPLRGLNVSASYSLSDDLDSGDFEEVLFGVAYEMAQSFALFAEYRLAELDFDESNSKFESDEFRLGMRFSFRAESSDDFF